MIFSGINLCTRLEVYSHNNSSREGDNIIIDLRYPPSHQLLPEILIVDPCRYFSKYKSQFIYCINITELDSVFYNLLTKPYGLISIMLSSRCEMLWQGIFQDQSSRIVLMNRDIDIFSPMGSPIAFPRYLVISITRNNYLQLWAKAKHSASIVKRGVSVCIFYCHKTGQYENVIM